MVTGVGGRRRRLATALLLAVAGLLGGVVRPAAGAAAAPAVETTAEPRRIVALSPACAEIVAGLGLAERLVGVVDYTDFPPAAASLPSVGSYVNPSLEAIVALRPDLVVATSDGNPPPLLARLGELGIAVHVLGLERYEKVAPSIRELGERLGREAEARRLTEAMATIADCIAAHTAGVPHPRVLLAYELAPIVAPGQGAFSNALIALAGGRSVTADVATSHYPRIGLETVVALAPEVVVLTSMSPASDLERLRTELARVPTVPAVRDGRLAVLASTNLDRPSQRVMLGLRELAATLHPALFADPAVCPTAAVE